MNVQHQKEKTRVVIIAIVGVLLLLGVVTFWMGSTSIEPADLFLIIIPIILVFGTMIIVWDRIKNIKAGLPSEDERAKKLQWKAGAYAYFTTIWIAVGSMWYNIIFADNLGYPELTVFNLVALIVLLSGIAWMSFYFYFMRKGDAQ